VHQWFVDEVASSSCDELCHNCDTKPALAAKTDFIDELRLLILRNLLKIQDGSEDSGLQARPLFSTVYKRKASATNLAVVRNRTYKITSSS